MDPFTEVRPVRETALAPGFDLGFDLASLQLPAAHGACAPAELAQAQ